MSDIDTVVVDSLKALDPEWPIREADIAARLLRSTPPPERIAASRVARSRDGDAASKGALKRCPRAESCSERLGFDRGHTRIQLGIVCFTICTTMNPSMTVRAEGNHTCWMIWAAIA